MQLCLWFSWPFEEISVKTEGWDPDPSSLLGFEPAKLIRSRVNNTAKINDHELDWSSIKKIK